MSLLIFSQRFFNFVYDPVFSLVCFTASGRALEWFCVSHVILRGLAGSEELPFASAQLWCSRRRRRIYCSSRCAQVDSTPLPVFLIFILSGCRTSPGPTEQHPGAVHPAAAHRLLHQGLLQPWRPELCDRDGSAGHQGREEHLALRSLEGHGIHSPKQARAHILQVCECARGVYETCLLHG